MNLLRRYCSLTLAVAWLAALAASGVHQIEEVRYFCAEHEAFHHGELAVDDVATMQWRNQNSEEKSHADCDVCTLRSRKQSVPVVAVASAALEFPIVNRSISDAPAPDVRETLVHLAPKHSPPTLSI